MTKLCKVFLLLTQRDSPHQYILVRGNRLRKSKVNIDDVFYHPVYGEYKILKKCTLKERVDVQFFKTGFIGQFFYSVVAKNNVVDPLVPTLYGKGFYGALTINDQDPFKIYLHSIWRGVLERCYNNSIALDHRPTYAGCFMNDAWHNLQNFKVWVKEQCDQGFFKSSYELDKDLLKVGNKEYGPDTCVFLPQRLNSQLQVKKKSEYNYLPGVNFDKDRNKFKSEVNFGGKRYYLPRRDTEIESFYDYKDLKEKLVREDSSNWVGLINPKAVHALENYSLDWVLGDKNE